MFPYLTVDHFFHWIVKIWDRKAVDAMKASSKVRERMLPALFKEYARWDKNGEDYTGTDIHMNSEYLRKILAKAQLRRLTPKIAKDVYRRLHSGRMRAQRFGAGDKFATENSIGDISRSFEYLLWSNASIQEPISSLLPGRPSSEGLRRIERPRTHWMDESGPHASTERQGRCRPRVARV